MHKYYAITTPVRTLTRFAHPCNVALGSPAGEVSRAANGSFRSSLAVPPRPRERPESAQSCRSRAFRGRSPHHPICRPSPSCGANPWFAEFTTYAGKPPDGEPDGGSGSGRNEAGAQDGLAARQQTLRYQRYLPLDPLHCANTSAASPRRGGKHCSGLTTSIAPARLPTVAARSRCKSRCS